MSAASSLATNSQQQHQSKIPNGGVNDHQYRSMSVTNPKPSTNTSSNTALSYQQRTSTNNLSSSNSHVVSDMKKSNSKSTDINNIQNGYNHSQSSDDNNHINHNTGDDDEDNNEQNNDQDDQETDTENTDNRTRTGHKHVDFKLNEIKTINAELGHEQNDDEYEQNTSNNINNSSVQPNNNNEENDEDNNSENQSNNHHASNDESAMNGSRGFRLRRRDTPHHLKGARVNSPNNNAQQLDPNEMKEILERYAHSNSNGSGLNSNQHQSNQSVTNLTSSVSSSHVSQSLNNYTSPHQQRSKLKPATQYIPENLEYEELRKTVQLVIHINRKRGNWFRYTYSWWQRFKSEQRRR